MKTRFFRLAPRLQSRLRPAWPARWARCCFALAAIWLSLLTGLIATPAAVLPIVWGYPEGGQLTVPPGLTNVAAMAVGQLHCLALKTDGTVVAWGGNSYGQSLPPAGLNQVRAVAAGGYHSLALKDDGTVVAWGANSYGQVTVPAGLRDVKAIAAGNWHSLAVKTNGTVVAWGYNVSGQTTVPAGLSNVIAVAAGDSHSLALRTDGTVVAWGNNNFGQSTVPPTLGNVAAIVAGGFHTLALKQDGSLVAWGYNDYGQAAVPGTLGRVQMVAAGWCHNLALKEDGAVVAWGYNTYGQASIPAGSIKATGVAAGGQVSAMLIPDTAPFFAAQPVAQSAFLGSNVTFLAVVTGQQPIAYQWQWNGVDLTGATNSSLVLPCVQLTNAGAYRVLATNALGAIISSNATLTVLPVSVAQQPVSRWALPGDSVTFTVAALAMPPVRYQWQWNGIDLPGETNAGLTLSSVQASQLGYYRARVENAYGSVYSFNAFLTVANSLIGWGQITPPPNLTNIVAFAAGQLHSLALQADGRVIAWGDNTYGQTNVPVGLSNVTAIAAGTSHSLALKQDGRVVSWGWRTSVPSGLSNVVAISGGAGHSLALLPDGTVVAWGDNWEGQASVPPGLANVVTVDAGYYHNLALKADGTVVAWGYNMFGQTNVPPGLSNVVAIAAGIWQSLALKADGTVVKWGGGGAVPSLTNIVAIDASEDSLALRVDGTGVVWGDNYHGERNIPSGLTNVIAIAAGGYHNLVMTGDGAPALTVQPCSQGRFTGDTLRLCGLAAGAPPLSYQWQWNGTNQAGATQPTLVSANFQPVQAGSYRVVVSNRLGLAVSQSAQITSLGVPIPPHIVTPPQSQTVGAGSNVTFTVTATGSAPLSYQWQCNGTNLAGANSSGLTLFSVNLGQAGSYRVMVSNPFGSETSPAVQLSVFGTPPVISIHPKSQTVLTGATVNLSVSASGSPPLAYQWQCNGTTVSNASSATLLLTNVQYDQTGLYLAIITNAFGSVTSSPAYLVVTNFLPGPWLARYNGPGNTWDAPCALEMDALGNLYVAGYSYHSTTNQNYALVKHNWNGNEQWTALYSGGPASREYPAALAVDSAGNAYLTGYSITPDRQFVYNTVKYDPAGSLLWQASYNFAPGPNYAKGVAVDKAGNAYVTGYSDSGSTGYDYATIKYDSAGNQLWVARYHGPNTLDDYGRAVAVDPASNVIVTGSSLLPNYRYEAVTIKYDPSGQQLWVARCPQMGQSYMDPQVLAVDTLGNIYVAGQSIGERGISDYAIAKYDTNGVLLWLARYEGPANAQDTLTSLKVDSAGNVYVTGTSVIDCNPPGTDYLICYKRGLVTVKFNSQGSQLWATRYQVPAEGTGAAAALALDSSNNVYITGYIDEPDWTSDYLTLKYNANGDQVWMATYNGSGNASDTAAALAVDGNGHVYVTGSSSGDFATLKYIPTNASGAPRLTLRPRDQQVYQGSNITFRVLASGTAPLFYQWRKNGENIEGATGTSLTLPNVQWSDGGDFSVIVSNLAGCTVSPEARLVVLYPPIFVREPFSQTVESGSHVILDAEVISPQPVSYQWQYSGIDIPNATNTTLVLSNVQPHQTGPYALIASNAYGVASAVAWLTVVPGSWVWEAFYHASPYDEAKAVAVDRAGNVYVTGYSSNELATIKYDANGNQLWVARYNGPNGGYDSAIKVAVDASGSVYVLGSSRPTNGPAVFVTVKYDGDGNQLWAAPYNGPGSLANNPVDLALDGAGNVYVTGTSTGPSGFEDCTTIKYDANGHQLWVARYNSPENNSDLPAALAVDPSGSVYVTGRSYPLTGNDTSALTIKYDASGQQMWAVRYHGPDGTQPHATALAVDNTGNVYITGSSYFSNYSQIITIKYDSAGRQLWLASYAGPLDYYGVGNAVTLDSAGHVLVAGTVYNPWSDYDYVTLCYESTGQQRWLNRYTGDEKTFGNDSSLDQVKALAVDAAGNVFVNGDSQIASGGSAIVTVMYDAQGNQVRLFRQGGPLQLYNGAGGMTVNSAGYLYVTGNTYGQSTGYDYVTTKYATTNVPGAPAIVVQPRSQTTWPGSNVTFSVTATGDGPLLYQWSFNGFMIPGATNSTLFLGAVQDGQRGEYSVSVANSLGVTVSPQVTLTLGSGTAPSISAQPCSLTVEAGAEAVFSVSALGSPPLQYQWQKNGVALPGQTNATLNLAHVRASDAGAYRVIVSNAYGSLTSAVATLTVTSLSLAEALDATNLLWNTGSEYPWYGQSAIALDGRDAAETRLLQPETQSWLATTVQGPGTVAFKWKTYCNGDMDYLLFYIDDSQAAMVFAEYDMEWQSMSFDIPPGSHNLKWVFESHSEASPLFGAWVDEVSFTPPAILQVGRRTLPLAYAPGVKFTVQLDVTPRDSVSTYALEEQPPSGWLVTNISHGGVFDAMTGEVKFGPFLDCTARSLSYEVIPPAGATGAQTFTGSVSCDGASMLIGGASNLVQVSFHPADNTPADYQMAMDEVTSYSTAWRRGLNWPLDPTPIPIDYVTRAAFLWRTGECYRVDLSGVSEALLWVPCQTNFAPGAKAQNSFVAQSLGVAASPLSATYIPGEPLTIAVTATPAAGTLAYAVEDQVPVGWTVSGISHQGAFDPSNRKVKWGPFFDETPRTLTYQATPPLTGNSLVAFSGTASFDGTASLLCGPRQLSPGSRLSIISPAQTERFTLTVNGVVGRTYLIEASSDLQSWTTLSVLTNLTGRLEISVPAGASPAQRFYRTRLSE